MIIVSIKEINKQRSRIVLDNDEKFVLYHSEIRNLKLKENMAISDGVYDNIMSIILPKRCKLRAMNLLKTKDYTEYQLRLKLKEGDYPETIIDIAMDYVKSYGYINDLNYASSYYRSKLSEKSSKEIIQKLQLKGISSDIIDKVVSSEDDFFDSKQSEKELIRNTLKKKHYNQNMDYNDKQKLLAYFYRRGFSIDAVRHMMDEFNDNFEE